MVCWGWIINKYNSLSVSLQSWPAGFKSTKITNTGITKLKSTAKLIITNVLQPSSSILIYPPLALFLYLYPLFHFFFYTSSLIQFLHIILGLLNGHLFDTFIFKLSKLSDLPKWCEHNKTNFVLYFHNQLNLIHLVEFNFEL